MSTKKNRVAVGTFIICIGIAMVLLMFVNYYFKGNSLKIKGDNVSILQYGWNYKWEEEISYKKIELPVQLFTRENHRSISIKNILPSEAITGAYLSVRTVEQMLDVRVDNQKIYTSNWDGEGGFGKGDGSGWHIIRLPENYSGKDIELIFRSPYKSVQGILNPIYIGNRTSIVFQLITETNLGYFLAVLIGIIGIAAFFICLAVKELRGKQNSFLYLALFFMLVGAWTLGESKRLQFIVDNQYLVSVSNFLTMALWPIAFLLFFKKEYKLSMNKFYSFLMYAFSLNYIAIILLQVTNTRDFRETRMVTQILVIIMIGTMLYNLLHAKKRKEFPSRFIWWGYLCLDVGYLLDMKGIIFYGSCDRARYFSVSIVIFMILLGGESIKRVVTMNNQRVKNQALAEIAYTDLMTGIKNRTAFQLQVDKLNNNLGDQTNIRIILMDLNNLKLVNDNLGHKKGDELIIEAATILKKAFHTIGKIFRIGGDEFVVVMKDISTTQYEEGMNHFRTLLETPNEGNDLKVSIAYGEATYEDIKDRNLYDTYMRADERMYICKDIQKKGINNN